jgi:hypothetical protein
MAYLSAASLFLLRLGEAWTLIRVAVPGGPTIFETNNY